MIGPTCPHCKKLIHLYDAIFCPYCGNCIGLSIKVITVTMEEEE